MNDLVRADGVIEAVTGRGRRAKRTESAVRGRPLHVVARGTALREKVAGAKAGRAAVDAMIRDWKRERESDRRQVKRQAAEDWKAEHGSAPSIVAAVARRGGIRLGRDWGKEAREEIPLAARRKGGHTMDDMLAELHYDGWRLTDDSQLYSALASRRDPRYQRGRRDSRCRATVRGGRAVYAADR